jgi:hypothetical protein
MGIYKGVIHNTKTHIHKCQLGEQFLSFNLRMGALANNSGQKKIDRSIKSRKSIKN